MNTFTLTNGEKLSVTCSDGHMVTVRKLDEQHLSIKVERVEGDWPVWYWLKGWLWWLLYVYISIVITLVLVEVTGNAPVLKEIWADVMRTWKEPALKRVWTEMIGVTPVLKRALANLSQAFKK